MLYAPQKVKGIENPIVHDAYVKKDFASEKNEGTLVLDVKRRSKAQPVSEPTYLSLLESLDIIKAKAESQTENIDYIDIRIQ